MLSYAAGRVDRYRCTVEVTARPENALSIQKPRENMEGYSEHVTITKGGFPMV